MIGGRDIVGCAWIAATTSFAIGIIVPFVIGGVSEVIIAMLLK